MQYAMLIYEPQEGYSQRETPENEEFWAPWRKYQQSLLESGVMVAGAPLQPASTTATTVRVRGGSQHVQDGPYADTKEQLGGFILIQARNHAQAVKLGAGIPLAKLGRIEVRPIYQIPVR